MTGTKIFPRFLDTFQTLFSSLVLASGDPLSIQAADHRPEWCITNDQKVKHYCILCVTTFFISC